MANLVRSSRLHLTILILTIVLWDAAGAFCVRSINLWYRSNLSHVASFPRYEFPRGFKLNLHDSENRGSSTSTTKEERTKALLVLATVPVAWGTFEPAIRYVYTMEPPVPGLLFNFAFYTIAASALLFLALINDDKTSWPTRGGLELGLYLFLGNAFQTLGLQTIAADRAAFLLQLTTVFVPFFDALFSRNARKVSAMTWIACLIALVGVLTLSLDDADIPVSPSQLSIQLEPGDYYIIISALLYTFHCLRLQGYARSASAIKLACCKALTETFLCATAVGLCIAFIDQPGHSFLQQNGTEILSFFKTLSSQLGDHKFPDASVLPALIATLWTGLITCAYTIYAQSFGQSKIQATTANLVYTAQPIVTAVIAYILLGESLGPFGYVGGFLIGTSVYLVISENSSP